MQSRAGFSLVEILVALVIIAILGGVVGVSLIDSPNEAKRVAAKGQITSFETALNLYNARHGGLPTQDQGLDALVEAPRSGKALAGYPADGYLESAEVPLDPWGQAYVYLVPGRKGETFEVICYGSDGEPDGEGHAADISSRDP